MLLGYDMIVFELKLFFREPFKKILAQGIIKGKTYRLKSSGKYLLADDVMENGKISCISCRLCLCNTRSIGRFVLFIFYWKTVIFQ